MEAFLDLIIYSLFSWHINLRGLFNAKVILVEKQSWYYLPHSFGDNAVSSRQLSILLHGCTTWTLTKRLEKKLDGNYTRMLRAILNKSWRQHPTRHQLYGHLPWTSQTCRTLLEKQGRTHK